MTALTYLSRVGFSHQRRQEKEKKYRRLVCSVLQFEEKEENEANSLLSVAQQSGQGVARREKVE